MYIYEIITEDNKRYLFDNINKCNHKINELLDNFKTIKSIKKINMSEELNKCIKLCD